MSKKAVQGGGAPSHVVVASVAGAIAIVGIGVAVGLLSQPHPAKGQGPRTRSSSTRAAASPSPQARQPLELDSGVRAPSEPEMRVRIFAGVDAVRINSTGGVQIGQGDLRGSTALPAGALTDLRGKSAGVSVSLRSGQWEVSELALPGAPPSAIPIVSYSARQSLVVQPSIGPSQLLAINGGLYAGCVRLTPRGESRDGAFDVVEFVGVEAYLPGVVAKEMLAGWPLAAYQAQAVAARSYALHERERSLAAGQPFDVESNDRDQAYAGATTYAPAREAVRSTRAMVLMDGDRLLRAYFSSTCGGRTAGARDSWPTGPGYEFNLAAPLQAHQREFACDNSPLFRWTIERPRVELAQRLRLYGERNQLAVRKLKDLKAIETVSNNGDSRPTRFKIVDSTGGSYQLSAEDMRLACNTGGPAGSTIATVPVAASAPILGVPELAPAVERPPMLPEITRSTRVVSSDIQIAIAGDRAIITGRGFGHGVGLCQYCAKGFAERGEDWRTMIERFYPGARIVPQY